MKIGGPAHAEADGAVRQRASVRDGVPELAAAMRGYEELGTEHIMFQCVPHTDEALRRLAEALHLHRGTRAD